MPREPRSSWGAGDIVVIPFPFTNLRARKQRPSVVLTPSSYNQTHPDLVLAYVTSRPQAPDEAWALRIGPGELREGRLPKPSWVRVDKLFTIEHALIRKAVARLAPEALQAVRERVADLLVHGKAPPKRAARPPAAEP